MLSVKFKTAKQNKPHHHTTSPSQRGSVLPTSELLRRHSRVLLEVSAEEREVAEVIVPRYLFYRLLLSGERLLYLQHHILIDNGLDGVAGHALCHHVEILWRDV